MEAPSKDGERDENDQEQLDSTPRHGEEMAFGSAHSYVVRSGNAARSNSRGGSGNIYAIGERTNIAVYTYFGVYGTGGLPLAR